MKTAVLIYGEIRGCPSVWKQLYDNIVVPNNADVFIHGYIYPPDYLDTLTGEDKQVALDYCKNRGINIQPPQELFDIFKPVATMFEYQISHEDENMKTAVSILQRENYTLEGGNPKGYSIARSQAYTRKRVIELKQKYEEEHGFKYDNAIQTRLDFDLRAPMKFPEKLNVMICRLWDYYKVCDQLLVGSNEFIDVIAGFYDAAPLLYVKHCKRDMHFHNTEFFLGTYIRSHNIPIQYYDWPSNWGPGMNGLYRFDKGFVMPGETCSPIQR
jgi:hypothetical protein